MNRPHPTRVRAIERATGMGAMQAYRRAQMELQLGIRPPKAASPVTALRAAWNACDAGLISPGELAQMVREALHPWA